MRFTHGMPARLRHGASAICVRIDALPRRERIALWAAVAALLLAAELLWVLPMQQRRELVAGVTLQAEQEQTDNVAAAAQAAAQELAELEATLRRIDSELARRGAGPAHGEALSAVFKRLLARQAVRVEALRELAAEDIGLVALPGDVATPAAAAASAAAPTLVRHRFELVLAGEAAALISAVRALDQGARPLRIERVRMAAAEASAVTASITFSVIGTERSWLSI